MQEVMEPILQIQVLGKFTLRYGETVISDEDDRSRKVWAVLAYLIYHREKIISQQELVDLCWGEDTRSSDPHNALKSVIHRIRATLDKLQEGLGGRCCAERPAVTSGTQTFLWRWTQRSLTPSAAAGPR